MMLSDAARAIDAQLQGDDLAFDRVSTDTRKIEVGALFVALTGPNFDGHDYLRQAQANGAVAVMVSDVSDDITLPQLRVHNTRVGLGLLAAHWRTQFACPVIAVTGSNGKTTVKEMIAAIFAQHHRVMATNGNLNNDIGVPLTLFRMDAKCEYAVIEMGANHVGEIEYLTRLTRPSVAVITNAARAHIEGFGSMDNIASAKGELFAGLDANGVAIVNRDDDYAGQWYEMAEESHCIGFGMNGIGDIQAQSVELNAANGSHFVLKTPEGHCEVSLPLAGKHSIANALAASAVAYVCDIALDDIRAGLERMKAVKGRLETVVDRVGFRLIDDTYNANPASFQVALDVLKACGDGERVLVLGDMAELGADAEQWHAEIGALAQTMGIEHLFAIGDRSHSAVNAFGEGGEHFVDSTTLVDVLSKKVMAHNNGITVLVKGSRSMSMDEVVTALVASTEEKVRH